MSSNPNRSSSFVQSTSVTSQFNALSMDREKFRNAKQDAQANYETAQEGLKQLKKEQASFLTKIRAEQEAFGTLNRKKTLLTNEQARLARVTDFERKAMEACANHTKALTQKADGLTINYASEMEEANDEVAGLLQQQIHQDILSLLSVESIEAVIVPKLPSDDEKLKQFFEANLKALWESKRAIEDLRAQNKQLRSLVASSDLSRGATATAETDGNPVGPSQQMDLFYGSESDTNVNMATN